MLSEMAADPVKKIMVVDDDASTRDALKVVLERQGYRVVCARDGREALDRLRREELPCVILLDLLLGEGMDGWTFRDQQRQDPAIASIPVIVVSATENVRKNAATLGAAGYLKKPFESGALLATVEGHCSC